MGVLYPLLPILGVVLVMTRGSSSAPPIGPTVPASECRSLMDLVFVLDGSDSIAAVDYQKQRDTLTDFVKGLHLGPNMARVGIVVYSSTINQTVDLTDNTNLLIEKTSTLGHPRDGTNTAMGISTMAKMFKKSGRSGVPWTSIVITDGISKNPPLTIKEAELAKKLGINMFAVGISQFIMQAELEGIASSPNQVLMLKTFDQLKMALNSLMKVVCPCPPLPPMENTIYLPGDRNIGSVREMSCAPGYQPMGNPIVTCQPDSTWTPLEFACLACPPAPIEFGNGIVVKGGNTLDTVREYLCKDGFASPVPITTVCVPGDNGPVWTTPATECQSCPVLIIPKNAHIDPQVTSHLIGTTLAFQCIPGFVPTGPIESTCINDKGIPKWTEPIHGCIACAAPPVIPNADVDPNGGTLVNDVRGYACHPGFHPTGPIKAICMGDKGAAFWKLTPHKCIACNEPPKLPNAVLNIPGNTLVGTTRSFKCLKGFQPTGPIGVTCMGVNGATFWDGPDHTCVACTSPPIIPNAILDPMGDTLIGSVRVYQCMKGYVPSGPIAVGCITGTGGPLWTAPEHQCITCDNPPPLPYALLDINGENFVGRLRQYTCIPGYVPTKPGPIIIECVSEYLNDTGRAFWSPPSHECTACPPPPMLDMADVLPGDNLVGTVRKYQCAKGMFATGAITIECLPSGQWSIPDHSCTACGPVPIVPHADILPGPHVLGTIRKYVCAKGFVPNGKPVIECMADALWSPLKFACVACADPYPVTNAVLEPGDNLVGAIRRYTCLPGYMATGPIHSTCAVPAGGPLPDWSTPVHFCKDCGDPYVVKNAEIISGPRVIGSVQVYKCIKGFVATDPPNSHCMQNAEWSPPAFKCIDKAKLNECMDLVGEMYKVKFNTKDYCAKPLEASLKPLPQIEPTKNQKNNN